MLVVGGGRAAGLDRVEVGLKAKAGVGGDCLGFGVVCLGMGTRARPGVSPALVAARRPSPKPLRARTRARASEAGSPRRISALAHHIVTSHQLAPGPSSLGLHLPGPPPS